MFCYTGPTEQQVRRLKDEFHIYCMEDGRFSMAGINSHNVDYLAKSVVAVRAVNCCVEVGIVYWG